MLFHLVAHAVNLALCDNVTVVQENHTVAHHIDLVKNVTRYDQVKPFGCELAEQANRFGASHRIQSVERLVKDHHNRFVRDCLRKPDSLAHAFAVSPDLQVGRIQKIDSMQCLPCQILSVLLWKAVDSQIRVDELKACQRAREGIELRAVADLAKEDLG